MECKNGVCSCFLLKYKCMCLHLNNINWDNIVQFNAHTVSDNLCLCGDIIQLEPLSWRILLVCLLVTAFLSRE